MPNHPLVRALPMLVLAVSFLAPTARGELAAWDQAEVTGLAKNLATATDTLYETFAQQPPPTNPRSTQNEDYYRLEHRVRMLRIEAHVLVKSLEEGEAREQTELSYEMLMSNARSARYEAAGVFLAKDVGERAAAVRGALNQLGPYYDADFRTLSRDPNIEAGATRPAPR